jgi:hypothetical protein
MTTTRARRNGTRLDKRNNYYTITTPQRTGLNLVEHGDGLGGGQRGDVQVADACVCVCVCDIVCECWGLEGWGKGVGG